MISNERNTYFTVCHIIGFVYDAKRRLCRVIQHELGKFDIIGRYYDRSVTQTMRRMFEVEAYKIEFIFDYQFEFKFKINSIDDITIEWVGELRNEKGEKIY